MRGTIVRRLDGRTWPVVLVTAVGLLVSVRTGRWVATAVGGDQRAVAIDAIPRPGRQLVFVYVGSSRCGPSNAPDLPARIQALMSMVRTRARAAGAGFVAVGIAREMSALDGVDHLRRIGSFDELAAGQGELNQAAAHFLLVDHRGSVATPQIIVVERTLVGDGLNGVDASVIAERVLTRQLGLGLLGKWQEAGAPLPSWQ